MRSIFEALPVRQEICGRRGNAKHFRGSARKLRATGVARRQGAIYNEKEKNIRLI